MQIDGPKVRLVLMPRDEVLAAIDAMSAADRAQVSPDWLARLRASAPGDPWTHSFAAHDRQSGARIGSCAFKSPPTAEGSVEIAYAIDPAEQGKGYATATAEALVAFAFGDDRVRVVRAHTLPEQNASTRVLTKCGFRWLGEVIDPEDGLVWRWERARRDHRRAGDRQEPGDQEGRGAGDQETKTQKSKRA